jgi:hypothetical protein
MGRNRRARNATPVASPRKPVPLARRAVRPPPRLGRRLPPQSPCHHLCRYRRPTTFQPIMCQQARRTMRRLPANEMALTPRVRSRRARHHCGNSNLRRWRRRLVPTALRICHPARRNSTLNRANGHRIPCRKGPGRRQLGSHRNSQCRHDPTVGNGHHSSTPASQHKADRPNRHGPLSSLPPSAS